MTTSLPEPGHAGVEDHVRMSHRFLEHAKIELAAGRRLQASEKVWGAVAHALKAIGEQRGWKHNTHFDVTTICVHIAHLEPEGPYRRNMNGIVALADSMHKNFYENVADEDVIESAIDSASHFIAEVDRMREAPPKPFTVRNRADQRRLSRMLETPIEDAAINYPINSADQHGFSRRPEEDEDNLEGPSGSRPPESGPLPAPTGRALERPMLPENANPPPV